MTRRLCFHKQSSDRSQRKRKVDPIYFIMVINHDYSDEDDDHDDDNDDFNDVHKQS